MTELTVNVPAPGSLFWETVKHPENLIILEGDEKSRRLPPDKLKHARARLEALQWSLNQYRLTALERLNSDRRDLERSLRRTPTDADRAALIELEERITRINARIFRRVRRPRRRDRIKIENSTHAREVQSLANRYAARIGEHHRALENEAINKRLADEMQNEIGYYASQIIDRWTALGYREEYYIKGKRHLRRIQFEESHFTEDTIQFKIYVTHVSILGSTIHHLPDRVRAWDLIKPETLKELEAACECPVSSPHGDDGGQGFERGAWLIVHRVGMRDGLFNYVELGTLIGKYNAALRPKFAAPVGIKEGRIIQYLSLTDVPHFMINGITGSGKTNLARVLLASWCQFYSPDEIRFVLVDLKRSGDMNAFESVPHLIGGIVKKINDLAELMPRLVGEMHARMKLFSDRDVVGIAEYNALVPENERLPRIVVFIDECGSIRDLASSIDERETVWRAMTLITTMARAAGIHLGLGTQQPGREVLPTKITNNVTYTVMGRQRTTSGAMMSTGSNRTKDLPPIRGRMLVDDGFDFTVIQTPHATDANISHAVTIARDYPAPRPFALPEGGDTEPVVAIADEPTPHGVDRAQILALTLHDLGGAFNAQKIYDMTEHVTPRGQIAKMIAAIVRDGQVEHDGTPYNVVKRGKGHALVRIESAAAIVSDAEPEPDETEAST